VAHSWIGEYYRITAPLSHTVNAGYTAAAGGLLLEDCPYECKGLQIAWREGHRQWAKEHPLLHQASQETTTP